MAGTSKKQGRKPPTQWPFPRDVTRKVTGPAHELTDSVNEARAKWEAWLRELSRVTQMTIPARSHGRKNLD